MKQTGNTTKPEWIKEQYPEDTLYTEISSGDEADVFIIAYQDGYYNYSYDIIRKSLWEGGAYSIRKKVI